MVEEAAPFVEVEDEHRAGPVRALGYCLEGLCQEGIAVADVGVRMIVVLQIAEGCVTGIDEGNCGQRARGAIREKVRVWVRNAGILASPERQEREIAVVVFSADTRCRQI